MGPRKPEIEYVDLNKVKVAISRHDDRTVAALGELKKLANGALKKGPFSIVTDKKAPHIAASNDPHDFLSYAPYFWPSETGDGKYVRHDGKRNPDVKLVGDQQQLEQMAEQVFYLCLGYLVFGTPAYAQHATHLLQVFFLDEATRMNPNVNYGQVIRGTTNPSGIGRAEGIMSTRVLAQVANVVPALEGDAGYQVIADPLKQWFQSYVDWLILSDMGKKEYASKNNHCTWYLVQVVTIGMTFGNSACQEKVRSMLASFLGRQVPHHIDSETGDQPLESARTRPYHYLVFNLQALLYLTDWARCHPVRPPWPLQEPLMKLAVDHLVDYDVTYTKEDMTEAVPLLRTMQARLAKHHAPYHAFYEKACQSDSAEKISGPKHQICYLWS